MASQTCEHCGSIVAPDEQFCPSCGSFMDPMSAPRPRPKQTRRQAAGNVISVSSDGPYEEFSLEGQPPSPERPAPARPAGNGNGNGRDIDCPSCGAINPGNNRHCQECGARLRQGPLPTAPRPAVQATAGVRAALAISGLLLGVILIALFFNIFNGEDPIADSSTTTTSTTIPQIVDAAPVEILDQVCTPPGIGGLICANLTSGTTDEYQVSWDEAGADGISIVLSFFEPIAITEIHWTNIEDLTRFRQNYRASSLTLVADDSLTEVPVELEDRQGTQIIRYTALNTTTLTINVIDAFQAEVVEDNTFDEIAIDEITVIGRPVTPTTNTTVPTGSTTTTAAP